MAQLELEGLLPLSERVRENYTGEERVAILGRHLPHKVRESRLCGELGLQPTVFYRWQQAFLDRGCCRDPRLSWKAIQ